MSRLRRLLRRLQPGVFAVLAASVNASDLFLFHGDFVYIIPRVLGDEMIRVAPRDEWMVFPQHTRYLDLDGDGTEELVAVALGASTGHGAQVRYWLRTGPDGLTRLGRWNWGAVIDPDGKLVAESFNR